MNILNDPDWSRRALQPEQMDRIVDRIAVDKLVAATEREATRPGQECCAMTPTTVSRVPNQPKTPMHSFRCPDELWEAAKATADKRGESVAEVLRKTLERYVKRG